MFGFRKSVQKICCVFIACLVCAAVCSCSAPEEEITKKEPKMLYGWTENEIAQFGASFYPDSSEEVPTEYMIEDKINVSLQKDASRNAACAAAMVLRYMGEEITGDQVYYLMREQEDSENISARGVCEWIDQQKAYSAQLYVGTTDDLKASLSKGVPVLVIGSASEQSYVPHVFVLTGYDTSNIFLADSAIINTYDHYNRKLTYEEFETMWGASDPDNQMHHLFIEVCRNSGSAGDATIDAAQVKTSAFETSGTKEYRTETLGDIDSSFYEPVAILDNYVILMHKEETSEEHTISASFYKFEMLSGQIVKLGEEMEYQEVIEPSFAYVGENIVACFIQRNSEEESVLNYYEIDPLKGTVTPLRLSSETAQADLFAWDQETFICFSNNKIMFCRLNGTTDVLVDNASGNENRYIETMAPNEGNIYTVEAVMNPDASAEGGNMDKVLRKYDKKGNLLKEVSLSSFEDMDISKAINNILISGKYICLEDTNEHITILNETDYGFDMESSLTQHSDHYVVCLNTETDVRERQTQILYFKSMVSGKYYLFDPAEGKMYDMSLPVQDPESMWVSGDKILIVKDNRLYQLAK